jgi:RNA polymerase sigma factor (sigma-70 family)
MMKRSSDLREGALEQQVTIEDLYRRHFDRAVRLAFLLTGDRSVCEDLAQEAFIRVANRVDELQLDRVFWSYLRVTITNLARKNWHRRRRQRLLLTRLEPSADTWQPDLEQRTWLWDAIRQLPRQQRIVVVLRFYESIPDQEVALILGRRPATVRSLAYRALRRLREVEEKDRGRG